MIATTFDGRSTAYTAPAEYIIPQLTVDPPHAHHISRVQVVQASEPGWAGRTVIDDELVEVCRRDEWQLALDES